MHGNRMRILTALTAFVVSQALIGCQSTPAPAPVPVVQPVAQARGGKTVVHLHPPTSGSNWSTGETVDKTDIVNWRAKTEFYVEFNPGQNPCDQDINGGGANQYKSVQTGNHYEAQCTIKDLSVQHPWEYQVFPNSPHASPTKPKKKKNGQYLKVIPCNGCLLDADSF